MDVYTSRTHGSYIEQTESKILWQYRDADPEFGALQAKELEDHLQSVLKNFNVDVLRGGEGGESGGYIEVRPKGVNKGVLLRRILAVLASESKSAKGDPAGDSSIALSEKKVDYALVLGDDNCDEPMFTAMNSVGKEIKALERGEAVRRDRASFGTGGRASPTLGHGIHSAKEVRVVTTRQGRARGRSPTITNPSIVVVSCSSQLVSPNLTYFTSTVGKKPSAAESFLNDVDEVYELLSSLTKISTRERKYFSSVDLPSMEKGEREGVPEVKNEGGATLTNTEMFLQNMSASQNSQTISAGLTRSVSMGNFGSKPRASSLFEQKAVPTTLQSFMTNLATTDEDADEENFF